MSLQLAAQHLAAQGRGPDKNLVHMSPREVAGLQALAMAHGGSLSINPKTGLPEAGFLENMLPMLIGVGVTAATGGAAAPWMVGLGLGGFEAARTGSLSKGLIAGLGAYGGAGIGAGLMGAGAETLGATANAMGVPAATGPGSQAAMLAAQNQGFGQAGLEALGQSAAGATGAFPGFVQTPMQSMTSGAMGLTEAPGRAAFMNAVGGGKEALKLGAAAAAPMLMPKPPKPTVVTTDNERYEYTYDPGRVEVPGPAYSGGELRFFDPRFTRKAADGGMLQANPYADPNAGPYSGNAYAFAPSQQMRVPLLGATPPSTDTTALEEGEYTYVYDPVTKTYKRSLKAAPKPQSGIPGLLSAFGGGMGNDVGGGLSSADFGAANFGDAAVAAADAYAAADAVGESGFGSMGSFGSADFGAASFGDAAAAAADGYGAADGVGGSGFGDAGGFGSGDAAGGDAGGDGGGGGGGDGGEARGGLMPSRKYHMAHGGISHLGDYSDGGRLLRGPGDGVSDSIPAVIGNKQPARLADGEFVVPARIVSELGNGSTDAGARKLYAMMDRIQKARRKTTGKNRVAANTRSDKYLPA